MSGLQKNPWAILLPILFFTIGFVVSSISNELIENLPEISIWGTRDRSWSGFDRPFTQERFSFSILNESNVNILAYERTEYPFKGFSVVLQDSELSLLNFASILYIECEASYPLKWIYDGDGWMPAGVKHTRKISGSQDVIPIYSYTSAMVIQERSAFVNQSNGRYTCIRRNMTSDDDISAYPFYNLQVINTTGLSRPSFNSPANSKCVQTTEETERINLFFNETDERYYCCSNKETPSKLEMLQIYCETPDSCHLKRNCPDEANSCVNFYNASFYNEELGSNCIKTERGGAMAGEFDCFVDNQCKKMMGYSRGRTFNGNVLYPLDDPSNITLSADEVLLLRVNERGVGQFEFGCVGPHFYVEFGFIWGLLFQNGSINYVKGEEGPFGEPGEVGDKLYVDIVEAKCEDLVGVICIAPLLNDPTGWINKSIAVPGRELVINESTILTDENISTPPWATNNDL